MRGDKRGRRFWTEGGRTGTVSGACGVPCREYYGGGEEEWRKLIGAANIVVQGEVEGDIAHTHYTFRMDRYRKIFILWFPNKTCFKKN